ncbi:MAG: glycosyltransferase family 2 protein [Pirellulales bacterium]|nr:glycosyltransferase family 2 protein [Pirellulales bacterium]
MTQLGTTTAPDRAKIADLPLAEVERRLGPDTLISVVIPCFNEEAVLERLFDRLDDAAKTWGAPFEVILVDDGSRDRTWPMMLAQHRRDPRWKLIRFARNFGHQTALRAGLHAASGDVIAVLDSDLQDPPEILDQFFAKWSEGYDVVYGVRENRKEHVLLRTAYAGFYRVLSMLAEVDVPLDAGDFSVIDRRIVEELKRMPERKPFIRGLRSWVGFRQVALPYDRAPRAAGETKYSLRRLVGLAIDGILSSSLVPLRLATWIGACVSLIAFLGALVTLAIGLFPAAFEAIGMRPVPGTASVIISVLFIGGVQLLCMGITGEYVGRIYENVKGRPFWVIHETVGVDEPEAVTTPGRLEEQRAGSLKGTSRDY